MKKEFEGNIFDTSKNKEYYVGKLSFDEWYSIYEDEINMELAETGADREMDFDPEKEFEKRYEEYLDNKKLVYLAIPFTFDPEKSFEIANKVAAKLMEQGVIVFSPISHSYPIALEMSDKGLMTSFEFWMKQDLEILRKCDEMIIVVIGEGGHKLIDESRGCQKELKTARELGMNISYYHYAE